jgi:hypothetical protein
VTPGPNIGHPRRCSVPQGVRPRMARRA